MWTVRMLSLTSRTLTHPSTAVAIHHALSRVPRPASTAAALHFPSLFTTGAQQSAAGIHTRSLRAGVEGIKHVAGVLKDLDVERKDYYNLPASIVPPSIALLTKHNVSVPPHLLLNDLPWDELLANPAIRENAVLFDQITQQHGQLLTWDKCGRHVDGKIAKAIVEKVGGWMNLVEIDATLKSTRTGQTALHEVLLHTSSSWEKMEMKLSKIQDLIIREEWSKAMTLAERGVKACDRLYEQLDAVQRNLQQVTAEKRSVVATCLAAGVGSIAVAGVLGGYLGIIENVSALTESAVQTLQAAAVTGSLVLFGLSAFHWLNSHDSREYMAKVEAARAKRVLFRNRFEEALDDVLFGNPDVIAAERE